MHKEDFYVFSNGILYRKRGNLVFQNEENLLEWPIHKIHSIRIYGNVTITTKLIKYLMNLGIDIYFYTSLGVFLGYTSSLHNKGNAQYILAQAKAYEHNRIKIAKNIVLGSIACMVYSIKNIYHHSETHKKLFELLNNIKKEKTFTSIPQLMEKEAEAWKIYYQYLNKILKNYKYIKRTYNPPQDEINALISFINSLLYGTINSLIREVHLNELISYLHQPTERRSSLVYDFADIFKPYFILRLLKFSDESISKNEVNFIYKSNGVYLKDNARKVLTLKYSSILKENKKSLWGKELNASIRTYIKNEMIRFRDSLLIGNGEYKYFLNWIY